MKYNKYADEYMEPSRSRLGEQNPSFQDSFELSSHIYEGSDDLEDESHFLKSKIFEIHEKFILELEKNQLLEDRLNSSNKESISLR